MSRSPSQKKKAPFQGGFLGSDVILSENPFLMDDISGQQNRILDAVRNPTNVLVYRSQPPSIHIVSSEHPSVLNVNKRNLTHIPVIPDSIRILIIRENQLKTLLSISGHPSLEFLEASSNLFEQVEFEPIPPRLRALILASNSITQIATRSIFERLQVLNLSGNRLRELDFSQFPVLKTLNLSFNWFTAFELNSPTLVELSIQNNSLKTIDVINARSLTHIDISFNQLTDISFVDRIPNLTTLNGVGNRFMTEWVSFAVASAVRLTTVNGRLLREGEIAIHRDRVLRFIRSTKTPHPHRAISKIRLDFRAIKNIAAPPEPVKDDIEEIWIGKSREKASRARLILENTQQFLSVSTMSDEGCLTLYGPIKTSEYAERRFNTLKLQYVPIIKGSDVEQRVIELAKQEPTMLTLDHNLLAAADDCMFLTAFETVEVLQIEGNEVAKTTLFRPLVGYLMASLSVVNGVALTTAEKVSGREHFGPLLARCKNIIVDSGLPEAVDPWRIL
jgi:hypothetical protein